MELKKYKLGDCFTEFHAGKSISAKEISDGAIYPVFGGNGLRGWTNTYNQDGQYVIIGRQGAYCGNVRYNTGKAYLTEHAIVGQPTQKHNAIYLSNILSLMNLSQFQGQSAQPGLSVETISNIDLYLPSIEVQREIASILYDYDRKIELNKQINDNLEAMAKQLYDYWFVQFDFPNEEGKPYKSSGGKMVWNEKLKREIPEGWKAANYTDLFTIGNGQTMPHGDGLIPAYGGNGIVKMVETSNYPACIIIGRVGVNCGSIHYSKVPCWVSDNAISVCPKHDDWLPFLFYSLNLYNLSKSKGGSSQPLITHEALKHLYFPMSENHISKFVNIANELQNLIYSNQQEILKLTKQRDELLPLLMNGQASVNYHL